MHSQNKVRLTQDELNQIGKIKMYGDRTGDGAIQTSFTLPMPCSEEARVAAVMFAENMGLKKVHVLHMEAIDPRFTFFVVYGCNDHELDVSKIHVPKLDYPDYSFDEINELIKNSIGRKIVVLGACIGTDAHTVGIDAIFNMKGYHGSHGLERYHSMDAFNLRAQVETKDLVAKIIEKKADAVLVSRVVTQRDSDREEFQKLLAELNAATGVPKHLVKICGGPRMTNQEAQSMGYDAGFGPGTLPIQVASYLATELVKRIGRR